MKKRRGLAALLAAAMCLSAIVPVYADEIAAETSADVDVVAETVDETAEVTDTDIAEGSATQAATEETETATEEVSPDVKYEEPITNETPEVLDAEETAVSEVVDTVSEEAAEAIDETAEKSVLDTDDAVYDADIVASGECGKQGDNVKWSLNSDGLLKIWGSGEMAYYYNYYQYTGVDTPWHEYCINIKTIQMAQSHILCKRKTAHIENINHYDETGKKDVGLICILPRSCSSVKRG